MQKNLPKEANKKSCDKVPSYYYYYGRASNAESTVKGRPPPLNISSPQYFLRYTLCFFSLFVTCLFVRYISTFYKCGAYLPPPPPK